MIATLVVLALIFGQLSLLAFGGGNTILPEMQRQVHHAQTNESSPSATMMSTASNWTSS